jgi:hypothetical protein
VESRAGTAAETFPFGAAPLAELAFSSPSAPICGSVFDTCPSLWKTALMTGRVSRLTSPSSRASWAMAVILGGVALCEKSLGWAGCSAFFQLDRIGLLIYR